MAAYYDSKTKSWYCKFRYHDWQGNNKSTTKRGFTKKKDALAYEVRYKEQATAKPTLTLAALSEDYLKDYKLHRKQNSYRIARKNISLYVLPFIGDLPIIDITPLTVRKWQNEIVHQGHGEATVQSIFITFKTMLNFAVKYYNLPKNPFTGGIKQRSSSLSTPKKFLEQSEWDKLTQVMTDPYDRAVFYTLYYSGLRIGELLGLTVDDINFQRNTITVNKQYDIISYKISTPKSETSNRKVTLPDGCMDIIKDFLDRLYDHPKYPFQQITSKSINERLQRLCAKAGVPIITLHGLRHSHASLLIRMGVPLNVISERLGHASPSITLNTYAHVYKQHDIEVADMLNKLI